MIDENGKIAPWIPTEAAIQQAADYRSLERLTQVLKNRAETLANFVEETDHPLDRQDCAWLETELEEITDMIKDINKRYKLYLKRGLDG